MNKLDQSSVCVHVPWRGGKEKFMGRRVCLGSLIAVLLLSAGCSKNLAEVSGTVTLDGQPVEEGSINFIPIEGNTGAGAGAIITKGRYHIASEKGVSPGKNRVEIRAFKNSGKRMIDPTGAPGAMTEERVPAFPPEYNDQSTLVREVKAGSNTFDFEAQTKKEKK